MTLENISFRGGKYEENGNVSTLTHRLKLKLFVCECWGRGGGVFTLLSQMQIK